MKFLVSVVWIALAIFIGFIANDIMKQVRFMTELAERKTASYEKCETSMHAYLDEIVKNKAGVIEKK